MTFMTMSFFEISGKYHKAIWTSSHVVMATQICDLRLHCQSLMESYFPYFGVVIPNLEFIFKNH
jgi:hypothetical protein